MAETSIQKQSFAQYKANNTIEEGDHVIAYLNRETMQLIKVQSNKTFHCKYGNFRHDDMIGLEYGSKVGANATSGGRGFLYLLYPTPELWTLILPHRTQILYVADISFVMNSLQLRPGMSMIESGTGSGSFSHSLARTLGPQGHLYTFEYHEERAKAAKKEFEEHGVSDWITVQCRDVCKDGFNLENKVDAVFLDLPAPWDAVLSAKKAFKQDKMGRICTFSPCIEQISRTVLALKDHGFAEIQMFECLLRTQDIRVIPMWTIDEATEKQRAFENKRKRRAQERGGTKKQRQSDGEVDNDGAKAEAPLTGTDDDSVANSPQTVDNGADAGTTDSSAVGTPTTSLSEQGDATSLVSTPVSTPVLNKSVDVSTPEPRERIDPKNLTVTRLPTEQPGHTSYLLFATFVPRVSTKEDSQ
ncbi:tRNA (adenine-N(1)-)-methyltransferase catalytic subunit trm61 [Lunasporangiospora selenospora]|uniref:tRNA (adenine(58)-N(1))-methyltransferase catalytic subunit TRM61 n=1 Tax=Lunasporangiospora selenospora TaxID=979761 RepID=A0A9P6KGX4_9FUNG|nr:tRNA (adenine-N(1)-)-methyltransferase catalytic subunit trm61 [Lunasporangiospora selenospora]